MKKLFTKIVFPVCALMLFGITAFGQTITGRVFFDGNNNGAFESTNEVGLISGAIYLMTETVS